MISVFYARRYVVTIRDVRAHTAHTGTMQEKSVEELLSWCRVTKHHPRAYLRAYAECPSYQTPQPGSTTESASYGYLKPS
jgi:hypothetical protein